VATGEPGEKKEILTAGKAVAPAKEKAAILKKE